MKSGAIQAGIAYLMWGVFPIYFHALGATPAIQVLAHRIFWSFVLLTFVLLVRRETGSFKAKVTWRVAGIYFLAAVILALNWFVYVWAVANNFVVEASLGYFINPLVSVFLGVVLLRERLRPFQWFPILLALAGVIYLTLQYGRLPWIALTLAFSFGFYGLAKKLSPLSGLYGLTLETAILFLPAAIYLLFLQANGTAAFGASSLTITLLLTASGIVTVLPLLFFANGARKIPLVWLGLLQYVAPTMQFLLGVFFFREAVSPERLIGFGIIWLALAIYSMESLIRVRRRQQALASE